MKYIHVTLSYIAEVGKIPNEEKLMTIAKYFKQEGRQEGEIKAYHKMALEMLKEGEPLSKISKYTALSLEELKKIKNQIH